MGVFNHNTVGFFRDLSPQIIPWYVGFFPCGGWFLGFSFAGKRGFTLSMGYFIPGMWFLRRHTVYFSFWPHRFCRVLIGNITNKAGFIRRDGGRELWDAEQWDVGWGQAILTDLEALRTLGVLRGLNVSSSYCLGWNTSRTGSWEVLPDALFEQLFPLQIGAVWRREC